MQRLIFVVALLIVAAIGAWLSFGGKTEAAAAPETSPGKTVPFDSAEWLAELRRGGEIEFVRESATPEGTEEVLSVVRGLGPLPAESVPKLISSLGLEASAAALAKATSAAEAGGPREYIAFLNERCAYEEVLRAEQMARQGDYVTLATGTTLPPPPEQFVSLGQLWVGYIGEVQVDAWFLFDLTKAENAAIRRAKEDWEEAEALLADDDVREFNLLPLEERRARIEAHFESLEQMNRPTAGASLIDHRANQLPTKFEVDRERFLVSRRIQRRY